jgi:hypothetical protein
MARFDSIIMVKFDTALTAKKNNVNIPANFPRYVDKYFRMLIKVLGGGL